MMIYGTMELTVFTILKI